MKPSGKVTASDGEEDDNFGGSETAFVRELRSFHNAITTGVHMSESKLTVSDRAQGDRFGYSVIPYPWTVTSR